jgi:hypothetical protein
MKALLLNRDNFRESVFKRDSHKCVMCHAEAVDAHHIIDRAQFVDGGYYIDNGVSLCSKHHIEAENGTIGCQALRDKANIKNIVLPEEFDDTLEYNKWGEAIAAGNRYKYPKTFHFSFSPGVMNDDRTTHDLSSFEGKEVVCTEKLDGENCLDESTIIHTEDGDKTIKEICETKYVGKVLSYNIDTCEIELKNITNHKIVDSDENDQWYEIELYNDIKLVLTSEHYVYLPLIDAYRKVSDLCEDDEILFLP